VDAPTYNSTKFGSVPYVDISAVKADGGKVVLNVVNRHLDQPVEVDFETETGKFSGSFEVAEVNGPDIKAENTFGSTRVQTTRKSTTAGSSRLSYRFPPHSYTMLKGPLS
jgi:alpha-N-arabinofuranosidase